MAKINIGRKRGSSFYTLAAMWVVVLIHEGDAGKGSNPGSGDIDGPRKNEEGELPIADGFAVSGLVPYSIRNLSLEGEDYMELFKLE